MLIIIATMESLFDGQQGIFSNMGINTPRKQNK